MSLNILVNNFKASFSSLHCTVSILFGPPGGPVKQRLQTISLATKRYRSSPVPEHFGSHI